MIIKVLFGHRKENYPGQHAPEALEVIDEYLDEGNPDWLEGQIEKHKQNDSFRIIKVVNINIDGNILHDILKDETPTILGNIKE